ncbi:MAG: OmpA family protein [Rhodobacteraceae bacterium]|nr:OmpA family protein [Paracoccaceae bacterium]
MNKLAFALAACGALSACGDNHVTATFFGEAGLAGDEFSDFGSAVENNAAIQSGDLSYTMTLVRRFDAEVQPTINFAFNSYALDEGARAILRQQASWIRQFPEVRFRVFGHTDLVGPTAYNRRLGLRRAQAAVLYLTSQGISRSRLEAVSSFGETQPLIVTEGRERRNRRTVTEVSGFVDRDPAVLNGKYAEIIFRDYVASAVVPATTTGLTLGSASGGE